MNRWMLVALMLSSVLIGSGSWSTARSQARARMVQLRGQISSCTPQRELLSTNIHVTATVANLDPEGGIFTVQFIGFYPGGGRQIDGSTSVTLGPQETTTVRFDAHPQAGQSGGECQLIAPQVERVF